MKVVVGTRGSKLALTQSKWVVSQLEACNPEVEFEIKIIKTKGDLIQNVPLDKIGDKGLFVKEIEQQLLEGKIDLAIHSMKDMPSEVCQGLQFTYTPVREDARDVLILKKPINYLSELPEGARIGTGSKRRKYQLLAARPDLSIEPIRGNIDTRISKIETENLDGIVLAAAGVKRIGREDEIGYYLPVDVVLPAPAQGALAIEIREADERIYNLIRPIEDINSQIQIEAERAFLKGVDGSCHMPIGAYA
ncbi:MAG: hydroxymethylbilane synthase, partial [Niameybacter sp.]